MVIKEIQKKSTQELKDLVSELKAQLFMLRFQNSTRQLEQPHKIQIVKKDIARVFTVLNQRENDSETKVQTKKTTKSQQTKEKVVQTKEQTKESK